MICADSALHDLRPRVSAWALQYGLPTIAQLPEYTEDLLNLLHVLGRLVTLEPAQATLLDEICAAPLLTEASLTGAGALASAPVVKGKKAKAAAQPGLFD